MIFTKNDIMMESELYGEITRISTACDMMIETFIESSDEDTFEEAGGKVFDSIKSAASSIIEKIKKFIQDSAKAIREKMDKRKIEKALQTLKEFDMKDFEKTAGTKKGPDILKAYDLLMKYEDLVAKYIDQIDTLFEGVKDSKRIDKLTKFSEEVNRNCDKLIGEINDTLTSPDKQITYNKNRYEAILKLGLTMDGNYEQFGSRIAAATDKLNAKINETFRSITESVELVTEAFGKKDEEESKKGKLATGASNIKAGLMNQLHKLQGFVVKHKKAVIAITSAVMVTTTGVVLYKKGVIPNGKMKADDKPSESSSSLKVAAKSPKIKSDSTSKASAKESDEKPKLKVAAKSPSIKTPEPKDDRPSLNGHKVSSVSEKSPRIKKQVEVNGHSATVSKGPRIATKHNYTDEQKRLLQKYLNTTISLANADGNKDRGASYADRYVKLMMKQIKLRDELIRNGIDEDSINRIDRTRWSIDSMKAAKSHGYKDDYEKSKIRYQNRVKHTFY